MSTLISKDENLKSSVVYQGYLILKKLKGKKEGKISIFEVAEILKKEGLLHGRQLTFALVFLYSMGIIDFKPPYIYKL